MTTLKATRLTKRQAEVLNWISDYQTTRGRAPTIREIGDALGIKSTNGVNDNLKALERKGYIEREAGLSRSLRVVGAVSEQDRLIAQQRATIEDLQAQIASLRTMLEMS